MTTLTTWQRLVITGTSVGSEIWQTGLSLVSTSAPTSQAALQTDCNTLEPFVNTWWTSVKPHIYSSFAYTGIKLFQYQGAATKAQYQAQTVRTSVAGSLVANSSPIDTALVVSLRTGSPSRSGRGRMYIPCHDVVGPTAGTFVGTGSADYSAAVKALANAIAGGSTYAVAVVSRTLSEYNLVTKGIADNKPDVQRRRENRIVPTINSVVTIP